MNEILDLAKALVRTMIGMAAGLLLLFVSLGAVYFPYSTDDPNEAPPPLELSESDEFYEEIYAGVTDEQQSEEAPPSDHDYVAVGRWASEALGVEGIVGGFVKAHGLHAAKALEIGSGSGALQDVVEDFTGLDIAASAARYHHKPFVHGSATDLPFEDSQFDIIWTVWTLEHVPNPERALQEMRRVVKPGGYLLIIPSWNNNSWAAKGYLARPYSDFGLMGKAAKASLILRNNKIYQYATFVAARTLRRGFWSLSGGGPTQFRYRRLEPNYEQYWETDADAINSLDPHETMLWHVSRGDQCVTCPADTSEQIKMGNPPIGIRVKKPAPEAVAANP